MGPVTYFAPVGLGILLTLLMHDSAASLLPRAAPAWAYWPGVAVVGVAVGALFQLVMFGLQGAFAQVVPAPRGRSIRGRAATAIGCLVLLGMTLLIVAGMLHGQGLGTAPLVLMVLACLALAGAILSYLWCWPTAARDFDSNYAAPPSDPEMTRSSKAM